MYDNQLLRLVQCRDCSKIDRVFTEVTLRLKKAKTKIYFEEIKSECTDL